MQLSSVTNWPEMDPESSFVHHLCRPGSIVSSGPVLKVHVAWCCHKLGIEPLLHHGRLQPFFLGEERIFLLGRRGQIAMHSSMSKWPQVVEKVLQLVHLRGGEDSLEGDCFVAAALGAVWRQVEGVFPVAFKERDSARE